jgi:iron(III) transport system ATP-binding protein
MLDVRQLVKTFPAESNGAGARVRAVDGVSFHVEPGRIFTLLGPSGSGKTTVLRCIAGLETPEAGEVVVAGRPLFSAERRVNVTASERGLGMVFQSYAIWPHMTVWEHAAFPLSAAPRRRRPPRAQVRERVERALATVRLEHLAGRRATDLSGGEQQRVALARALVMEPPLLLLDEPLSNLDAGLRVEMRDELGAVQRELGVTCLYVTHDQEEALAISNSVAVMRGGRIEQAGEPRELYERPSSRFVADFIGRANLIEGTVHGHGRDGSVVVRAPQGELLAAGEDVRPGDGATVVVRPERLELRPAAGTPVENGWVGTVRTRAFLGDAVDHVVEVGGLDLRVRSPASLSLAPGTRIVLRFPPEPLPLLPGEPSDG